MKLIQKKFILLSLLSTTLSSFAWATSVPTNSVVGKIGFDWLQPKTAKCTTITETLAAGFKTCRAADANSEASFTGKKDFFTCKISEKSEYEIYPTKARCVEELETMKANGD